MAAVASQAQKLLPLALMILQIPANLKQFSWQPERAQSVLASAAELFSTDLTTSARWQLSWAAAQSVEASKEGHVLCRQNYHWWFPEGPSGLQNILQAVVYAEHSGSKGKLAFRVNLLRTG